LDGDGVCFRAVDQIANWQPRQGASSRRAFGPRDVRRWAPQPQGCASERNDPRQLVLAFGEALAHVNAMIRRQRLRVANAARGLALEAA
jgi:hypothetical protein